MNTDFKFTKIYVKHSESDTGFLYLLKYDKAIIDPLFKICRTLDFMIDGEFRCFSSKDDLLRAADLFKSNFASSGTELVVALEIDLDPELLLQLISNDDILSHDAMCSITEGRIEDFELKKETI